MLKEIAAFNDCLLPRVDQNDYHLVPGSIRKKSQRTVEAGMKGFGVTIEKI